MTEENYSTADLMALNIFAHALLKRSGDNPISVAFEKMAVEIEDILMRRSMALQMEMGIIPTAEIRKE